MTIDHLTQTYIAVSAAIKDNPVLAGAFSLWGLTVLGILIRNIPTKLWTFIVRQSTVKLEITNSGYWSNKEIFLSFMLWASKASLSNLSRTLALEGGNNTFNTSKSNKNVLGPGTGLHYFWFKRRLFWYVKTDEKGSNTGDAIAQQKIVINTLGRSHRPIHELVAHFAPAEKPVTDITIFEISNDRNWVRTALIPKRPLESVILPQAIKDELTKAIDDFHGRRDWYIEQGVAHKLCVLLYGKPGTGKTSLIKALASKYDADVYVFNLHEMSNFGLRDAISKVPPGSIVLVEDFDSAKAVHARAQAPTPRTNNQTPNASPSPAQIPMLNDPFEHVGLDLSTILNTLDGIASIDNLMIFLTTNHIEKIDPALLRRGRTDIKIEVPYLTSDEIHQFVSRAYGRQIIGTFVDTPGCELHGLLLDHKEDFDSFYADLIEKFSVPAVRLCAASGAASK
jgi:chaperone BCS1